MGRPLDNTKCKKRSKTRSLVADYATLVFVMTLVSYNITALHGTRRRFRMQKLASPQHSMFVLIRNTLSIKSDQEGPIVRKLLPLKYVIVLHARSPTLPSRLSYDTMTAICTRKSAGKPHNELEWPLGSPNHEFKRFLVRKLRRIWIVSVDPTPNGKGIGGEASKSLANIDSGSVIIQTSSLAVLVAAVALDMGSMLIR